MHEIIGKAKPTPAYLLGAIAAFKSFIDLTDTELVGGSVTGLTIDLAAIGALLFLAAIAATFIRRKAGAITGILAALICLPLYTYRLFPRPFARIVGGVWAVPPTMDFSYHPWSVAGALTSILVLCLCAGTVLAQVSRTEV